MAIIPVERRFTSGISTLKWHTRWSKDEKGAEDGDGDETGDEAKNWASGFIVFKVWLFSDCFPKFWSFEKKDTGLEILGRSNDYFQDGQQKAHIEVPLIDKIPKKRSLCWVYISDGKTSQKIAKTQMQLIEDRCRLTSPKTGLKMDLKWVS